MTLTTRAVVHLIAVTALVRLALAALLGLSVDESYSVAIARQFSLSYFDHPPLHLWLAAAWARLTGSEQPGVLRLPDIALFAGSTWLMYRLTASVYGERAGLWAALSLNLAPLFTLNLAGIVPDAPLVFFSLLTVWCFTRAVLAPAPASGMLGWMLGAGVAAGLALLSKYTAIFLILGLGAFLLGSRPRLLARPTPWLAVLLAGALLTPVLLWNHAHGWVSFEFQGARVLPAAFSIERAAAAFAGQLLYLLPWTGVALLYALVRALRAGPSDSPAWLCACLATGPIAAFSLIGLWTPVLPHWPAIGWLFAFPLLGDLIARFELRQPRAPRRVAAATAVFLVCLVSLAATQAVTGWLDRALPSLATRDPTLDLLDWRALRPVAEEQQLRQRGIMVATISWIDAGKVDYALGGTLPVLCLSRDPRHFAFLHDPRSFFGRDAFIVAEASRADWLQLAGPYFRRIEPGEDVVLRRASRPALTLHTAYGYGFRGNR